MDGKEKYLLLKTVQKNNILPVTSHCNMRCKFCSHYQNPAELKVYSFGHLEVDLIEEMIDYLPEKEAVILGESATKIIEGEPFYHPEIEKILSFIRKKWSKKKIKITTNGSFLNKSMVSFLADLENIELNVSLNCADSSERAFLMSDKNGKEVFQGIELLSEYGLAFNGSLVALPHLMGWDSIEKTVSFLDKYGAETIRVFMPGFTDYTNDEDMRFKEDLYNKLKKFVEKLEGKYQSPVIFEPPWLDNFKAVIEGVIDGLAAKEAEIETGDIIEKINGRKVVNRVDGFLTAKKLRNPVLGIRKKDDSYKEVFLEKSENKRPGFVVHYDLHPQIIDDIGQKIERHRPDEVILMTSVMARGMIEYLTKNHLKPRFSGKEFVVLETDNNFFGGSIVTAGLLIVDDLIRRLKIYNFAERKKILILLPGIIFDDFGKDLIGNSFNKIEDKFKVDVELI